MKVKIKLQKKVYVKLLLYINRLELNDYLTIDAIDKINIRELAIDALFKHEKYRYDKVYNAGIKASVIILDVNKFRTIQKIFNEMQTQNYEYNLLHIINNQVTPQIKHQLNMFDNYDYI